MYIYMTIPYKDFDRSVRLSLPCVEYFAKAHRRNRSKLITYVE